MLHGRVRYKYLNMLFGLVKFKNKWINILTRTKHFKNQTPRQKWVRYAKKYMNTWSHIDHFW